ncbi:MAG TPA: MFS transporter [Acidimicrobiia bacterium]|nr:MFS transporter [Acidimicrobiia bacterium]
MTPRFVLVVACGLCYFLAITMLTPVLPHYVKNELSGSDLAVGIAVGAFSVGAVLLRLFAGRIGDTIGRRFLIVSGALLVAGSTVVYGLVHSLAWLIGMRVITGFGEAFFFVGAATMITDLAPESRRGEAVSYWSVAVYGGLAFGPALGDVLRDHDRFVLTFVVASVLAVVAAILGLMTRDVPRTERGSGTLFHRAALRPGIVLFLGLMPLSAFTPLLPLYVDSDVKTSAGVIFLIYGVLILGVRIIGARLPDTLGPLNAGALALVGAGSGMVIIALWPTVVGLVLGTIVFACGMSLLYPSLLVLALVGIRDSERASVVGTFSSFFDMASGFGAAIAGGIAEIAGYRGAFAVSGGLCALGLLILRGVRR